MISCQYSTDRMRRLGIIRRTGNEKRGRGRPNLTWEEFMKRDLKDRCITKELALDRREWKLARTLIFGSFFLLPFCLSFFPAPSRFFDLALYCLFSFFDLVFLSSFVSPLLFRSCFVPVFLLISSLAYPNLLGNKMLGGCCCCCIQRTE
jgi:hypothetical protein